MSANKCYGVPNNVYNNFPGVMNDGSIFTSHKPSGSFNSAIRKAENINNNSDYRKYLQSLLINLFDHQKHTLKSPKRNPTANLIM